LHGLRLGRTIARLGDSLYDSSTDRRVHTATPEPDTLALLTLGVAVPATAASRGLSSLITPRDRAP